MFKTGKYREPLQWHSNERCRSWLSNSPSLFNLESAANLTAPSS